MEQADRADRAVTDQAVALQVREYELLQRRVEHERTWRLVRMTGGTGVTATIVAYAVAIGQLEFLAVTPILYGITMMAGLRSTVEILYLHRQMMRLESKLQREEPLFDWVSEHGPFGDGQALYVSGVDLNTIPRTALAVLLVSAYFVLVALGVATWSPPAGDGPVVSVELLAVGYVTFTAVFVAIGVVGYLHYRRLARDVRAAR